MRFVSLGARWGWASFWVTCVKFFWGKKEPINIILARHPWCPPRPSLNFDIDWPKHFMSFFFIVFNPGQVLGIISGQSLWMAVLGWFRPWSCKSCSLSQGVDGIMAWTKRRRARRKLFDLEELRGRVVRSEDKGSGDEMQYSYDAIN